MIVRLLPIALLCPFFLQALPIGNPSSPLLPEEGAFIAKESAITLEVGYLGDWVLDRSFTFKKNFTTPSDHFDDFYMMSQNGRISLNFADRVELHAQLGQGEIHISQMPTPTTKIQYLTNPSFIYGVFSNALIAFWGKVDLSLTAAYSAMRSSFQNIKVNGASESPIGKLHYNEWNVSLGFSYKADLFSPYAGLSYSNAEIKFFNVGSVSSALSPLNTFAIKNKRYMGLFLGCGLEAYKALSLNIESRLVDETAITATVKLRF